jgi:FkbH-like protein
MGLSVLRTAALDRLDRLARRGGVLVYLAAPLPPLLLHPKTNVALAAWLTAEARMLGARIVEAEAFSLSAYLQNGSPLSGDHLGAVAEALLEGLLQAPDTPKKVLVTDFDGVLWTGVVGDDGPENLHYRSEGAGFRHFLYQRFLLSLKDEGVVLAGVTRNQREVALSPFQRGDTELKESDLVVVLASHGSKSAQIRQLAEELNLGLDSFVFVDDNPVELAEVGAQLPQVTRLPFPEGEAGLASLFLRLRELFGRVTVTEEDRARTELYRRRLEGMAPSHLAGADLKDFLAGLKMRLTIYDRSKEGDRTRAVQLINKTNQFNLNGRRWGDGEIDALLSSGGQLFGAALEDRIGSHGEILACLLDSKGVIRAWVMSCRVFRRRVEFTFLNWLIRHQGVNALDFNPTERNRSFRDFLKEVSLPHGETRVLPLDGAHILANHSSDDSLFLWAEP